MGIFFALSMTPCIITHMITVFINTKFDLQTCFSDSMTKICVIILIGLPGAGKTTFCTQMKQRLQVKDNFLCHTVTYDDIVDDNYLSQYKESRNTAFKTAESIIKSAVTLQSPSLQHLIFIDDNMYYSSMRYQYYRLAKEHELSFLQVYLDAQLETALARNRGRDQKLQIPEAVIRNMANRLEVPGEQWESNTLYINSNIELDEATYTSFLEALSTCLVVPLQKTIQVSPTTIPVSRLQVIDLLLRKIVHTKIGADSSKATALVKRKKDIYQDIREGQIVIGEMWSETELSTFLENLFCDS